MLTKFYIIFEIFLLLFSDKYNITCFHFRRLWTIQTKVRLRRTVSVDDYGPYKQKIMDHTKFIFMLKYIFMIFVFEKNIQSKSMLFTPTLLISSASEYRNRLIVCEQPELFVLIFGSNLPNITIGVSYGEIPEP